MFPIFLTRGKPTDVPTDHYVPVFDFFLSPAKYWIRLQLISYISSCVPVSVSNCHPWLQNGYSRARKTAFFLFIIISSSAFRPLHNVDSKKNHFKYTTCQQLRLPDSFSLTLFVSLSYSLLSVLCLKTLNSFLRFCSSNKLQWSDGGFWVLNLPLQKVLSFLNMNHHIL